jgi:hypothetical protein
MELDPSGHPAGSGSLSMAASAHVLTLARVAELLGEDEDLLHEISIGMEPEDGVIGVHGLGDDYTPAFTEFGIENLRDLIERHKADARRASEVVATKRDPGS